MLCPLERGDADKVKKIFFLQFINVLDYFDPPGCRNLTVILPDSHKGILTHEWLLKYMFLWGHVGWCLLLHHLPDVTQMSYHFT